MCIIFVYFAYINTTAEYIFNTVEESCLDRLSKDPLYCKYCTEVKCSI